MSSTPFPFPPQCDMVSDVCFKVSGVQRCVNTDPGFHCLLCPKRYKGTQPFGMGVEAAKKHKQVSRGGYCSTGESRNAESEPQSIHGNKYDRWIGRNGNGSRGI